MATISGLIHQWNDPNFVGPLYAITPKEGVFLSMLGVQAMRTSGGGRVEAGSDFTWATYDNKAPSQPAPVFGADPDYEGRDRTEASNVVQTFQWGHKVSYQVEAQRGELGPYASSRVWSIMGRQPVSSVAAFQTMAKLEEIKRTFNFVCHQGTYQRPSDNNTGFKTRGMLSAISSFEADNFSALGNATFDFTGGGVDDEWTLAAHGLMDGDEVQFSAVGSAPTEFIINTPYFVIYADATTFQLAASKADALTGTQIQGTADDTGTFTLKKANKLTRATIQDLIRQSVDSDTPARWSDPVMFCGGAYSKQVITRCTRWPRQIAPELVWRRGDLAGSHRLGPGGVRSGRPDLHDRPLRHGVHRAGVEPEAGPGRVLHRAARQDRRGRQHALLRHVRPRSRSGELPREDHRADDTAVRRSHAE